jgi:hypothetical protein
MEQFGSADVRSKKLMRRPAVVDQPLRGASLRRAGTLSGTRWCAAPVGYELADDGR